MPPTALLHDGVFPKPWVSLGCGESLSLYLGGDIRGAYLVQSSQKQ